MMKKLLVFLLVTMTLLSLAACGGTGTEDGSTAPAESGEAATEEQGAGETEPAIADANDLLTKVWAEYNASAPEELRFPAGGGNAETMVMDQPAKYDPTLEYAQDTLTASFCATPEFVAQTDDISTLMNMMMANNFTAAAYHITDSANTESAVMQLKDATMNNQWMCGIPEKLIIVTVGDDYILYAFGNGQVIDNFSAAVKTLYADEAVFVVEEAIQ